MTIPKTKRPPIFWILIEDTEDREKCSVVDWLKARKPYMCGTDSAKAMGLSRFKTPIDLYEDKICHEVTSEEITIKQHYRLQSGHAMEPVIQEAIAFQIGAIACRDKRMFVSNRYAYMACNVDGYFKLQQDCVIQGILFKKTRRFYMKEKQLTRTISRSWRRNHPWIMSYSASTICLLLGIYTAFWGLQRDLTWNVMLYTT